MFLRWHKIIFEFYAKDLGQHFYIKGEYKVWPKVLKPLILVFDDTGKNM
jgi:hypothetical protein